MPKTLDAIISENTSVVIKSRAILHTFSAIGNVIDATCKLNSTAWKVCKSGDISGPYFPVFGALIFLNVC